MQDLKQLIEFEFRTGPKLIKTLRKGGTNFTEKIVEQMYLEQEKEEISTFLDTLKADMNEVIISQLEKLRKKRPHFLLLIDEIDAFARNNANASSTLSVNSMKNVHNFKDFLKSLISRGTAQSIESEEKML